MLRIACGLAALFAVTIVPAAHAQPKVCKKVDVSFACRNGGSGTATLNCRAGESEARCCARLRRRAADPRRGYCTGRNGGLISFRCGCAKKGGGDTATGRDTPLRRLAPRRPDEEPAIRKRPGRVKAAPVERPGRGARAGACQRVKYAFSCRGRGRASAEAGCRPGEGKAACCKRVAQLARQSCARQGGVASFKCDCMKKGAVRRLGSDRLRAPGRTPRHKKGKKKGNVEFEWKVEEGESSKPGPRLKGRAPGGQGAKRCPRVAYAFSCRGTGSGSGRAGCRRGESEARCCARVRASVQKTCARNGGVRRFRCACPEGREDGRRLRRQQR